MTLRHAVFATQLANADVSALCGQASVEGKVCVRNPRQTRHEPASLNTSVRPTVAPTAGGRRRIDRDL